MTIIIPHEFIPKPWQPKVISRISNSERLNVHMEMGMGKTVSTLTGIDVIAGFGGDVFPILVIAPKKVAVNVWPYEHLQWEHLKYLKVIPITGTVESRSAALMYKADIYTINYENLVWLVRYLNNRWPFKTVICDESPRLKSFRITQGGSRAHALAARAKHTKYWFNLTGEPCSNGLQDLWGPQWFIDYGDALEKSYTRFTELYFTKGFNGYALEPLAGSMESITEKLKPSTVLIRHKDYISLDAPVIVKVRVVLEDKKMQEYKRLERELFLDLKSGRVTATNAADKTMKCLQFASGAIYSDKATGGWEEVHSDKLQALESIITESGGESIIVAYHFKSDLARIRKKFPESIQYRSKKDEDAWNAGKIKILLVHPFSCGEGLNLQWGGRRLVFFSHWWALGPHNQVIERIGPMRQMNAGLDRLVYIYYIISEGTMDELVLLRHTDKRDVQDLLKSLMVLQHGG